MTFLEENLFTKKELRFKNGRFRILTVSDLHGCVDFDRRLIRDLNALLDEAKPDFVMFNGDIVWRDAASSAENLHGYLKEVMACVESRKIPWAHVYGNHDCEEGLPNDVQQEVYESFEYCLTKRGPKDIHGVGNYVLPVLDSQGKKPVFNLWALDTHRDLHRYLAECGLEDDFKTVVLPDHFYSGANYSPLYFDQLMWYWNSSVEFEKHYGERLPSLLFCHVPPPEFILTYKNVAQTVYRGNRRESVCCSEMNSGLFSTLLQRGEVRGIVCGHEHINDFTGTYCSIKMMYDAGLSYNVYCDDDLRGGRVIEIVEENPEEFNTYMLRCADCVENYQSC